jgi:hypothetical protein
MTLRIARIAGIAKIAEIYPHNAEDHGDRDSKIARKMERSSCDLE